MGVYFLDTSAIVKCYFSEYLYLIVYCLVYQIILAIFILCRHLTFCAEVTFCAKPYNSQAVRERAATATHASVASSPEQLLLSARSTGSDQSPHARSH